MFKFPFSNLHELNLDWILEQVKKFSELIPPMSTAVEDVQALQGDVAQAVTDAQAALENANVAAETAAEALEVAEQAASGTIADGAVITDKIANGAVTRDKIALGAVGTDQIENNTITGGKIVAGTITAGNLDTNSVTTQKINNKAVTNDKLDDNAVTTDKILDGTILAEDLHNGAVTNAKIADEAINANKLMSSFLNSEIRYKIHEISISDVSTNNGSITRCDARIVYNDNIAYFYYYIRLTGLSSRPTILINNIPNDVPFFDFVGFPTMVQNALMSDNTYAHHSINDTEISIGMFNYLGDAPAAYMVASGSGFGITAP